MDESRELLDAIRGLQDEVARLRKRLDHLEQQSPSADLEVVSEPIAEAPIAPTAMEAAQLQAEEKVQNFLNRNKAGENIEVPVGASSQALPTAEPGAAPVTQELSLEGGLESVPQDALIEQQLRAQLGEPGRPAAEDLPPIPPDAVLAEFREHIPPKRPHENMESRIASYWFLRIAVAAITIGFIYYARRRMVGPIPKISAGYLGAIALVVLGLWRERSYPVWAHPLIAAGLALSYLTTYAMGFIGPMRIIESLPLELTLLSLNVLLVMIVAEWRKSETIAGVALVLGYMTTLRSHTENYALYSVGVLSVAAIIFIWRNRWYYASLGAVIATYGSHLYTWLYLPGRGAITTADHFNYHAVFLTAYFLVFAIGSLLTRSHATTEEGRTSRERALFDASDATLLATFTRMNAGLYLGAMILLLQLTRVYWERAWVFFFAYASVTVALSLGYRELPKIRFFYRMVASLAITFGIISYCSPAWLPVLVAVQAVALLYFAGKEESKGWALLSALVLGYSGLYVMYRTFATLPLQPVFEMRWWTVAGCAIVYLAYAELLKARISFLQLDRNWAAHAVAAVGAVIYYLATIRIEPDLSSTLLQLLLPTALIPLIGLATRRETLYTFAQVGSVVSGFGLLRILFSRSAIAAVSESAFYSFVPLALTFALVAERFKPTAHEILSRTSTLVLVLMQMCMAVLLAKHFNPSGMLTGSALAALVTVAIAAVVGSRPLLASIAVPVAAVFVLFFFYFQDFMGFPVGRNSLLICGLLLVAVAAVVGSRRFVSESREVEAYSGNASFEMFIALGSAMLLAAWSVSQFPTAGFLFIAVVAAIFAAYSVLLSRRLVVFIVLLMAFACGLSFLVQVGRTAAHMDASAALFGCLTAAVLVGVERIIALERQYASRTRRNALLNEDTVIVVSGCLSTGALVMLILSLHSHPDVKQLLFTVAMAAAGCAWIGLGFGFNSAVYRRAGFGVICVAIAKAFLYDVWRLPESYIAASFIGLGLFLLPISYIYTKNREKINRWL